MTSRKTMKASAPVSKGDLVRLTIEDLGGDGEGIGHLSVPSGSCAEAQRRYTIFVKDTVIGDEVTAVIMKALPGFAYAKLRSLEKPSPDRIAPVCPIARQCGGCQLQELRYDKQLEFKQRKLRENLIRLGGFDASLVDAVLLPIVGMEDPFRYRNKAQIPLGTDRNGHPVAGYYAGRTHDIIPMTDCMLGARSNEPIVQAVLEYMAQEHVPAYDEKTGSGLLRHLLIRTGVYSGEIMVCLVVNGSRLPREALLTARLRAAAHITGISINTNKSRGNKILGSKLRVLWGASSIRDSLQILNVHETAKTTGTSKTPVPALPAASAAAPVFTPGGEKVEFCISPLSFYQVNPHQTEKLYSLVLSFAGLTGAETVWDLYCGIGTISLFLARRARFVFGVEVIPEAIRDARENARLNGITNVQFETGRAEEVLPAHVLQHQDEYAAHPVDVIVVDPPRRGLDDTSVSVCLAMAPSRIVYVSCDPATLSRDLAKLTRPQVNKAGQRYHYELRKVQAVDQFGQTTHVETVVLLQRETS